MISDAPSPAPFAVLQLDRGERDPMALAKALAAARGTPVHDQVIAARSAWGIVADDLPEEAARALGRALREAGVECAVGPVAALPVLPDEEPATSIAEVPEGQPVLISVAAVTTTTAKTTMQKQGPSGAEKAVSAAIMMTTGLPIKIGGKKRTVEKTQQEQTLSFYADLHYASPSRRVRIAASDFDFSFLKERMLYQAMGNLKLLITDLAARAPDAWRAHGTRVLLEGKPIRTMGYSSLDDLEREARWLLTLRTLEG